MCGADVVMAVGPKRGRYSGTSDGNRKVDVHVGRRLRLARMLRSLSQNELGAAVGVTFQQVQKYERGDNKIGASRLYQFSRVLGVEVGFFFDGASNNSSMLVGSMNDNAAFCLAESEVNFGYELLDDKEILALIRAYNGIQDQKLRRRILELVRSLNETSSLATAHDSLESDSSKSSEQAFDSEI